MFKLALKVLMRRKFFTFISLFGISLTLVVLMIATAILDNAFAPRAPESRFDRVLVVYTIGVYGPQRESTGTPGYRFLDRYMRGLPSAEETSTFSNTSIVNMYPKGEKIETHVKRTDGAYWRILDFHFLEGGPFTQIDDDQGNLVAVITDDMRQKLFGGANAVGKTIDVDGQRFRVIGVVPAVPITRFAAFSEIWVPNKTQKRSGWQHQLTGGYSGMVLARSRADFPKLRAEFRDRLTRFVFEDPKRFNTVVAGLDTPFEAFARGMIPMKSVQAPPSAPRLRLILGVLALLFITLPTMNLVSINLSRIMERASEIGVRKAFGAPARTLVGQFLVENILLTLVGGVIGYFLSSIVLHILSEAGIFSYARFTLNLRVFAYGMALALVFGVLSGVYPAWRMSRLNPVDALKGGVSR